MPCVAGKAKDGTAMRDDKGFLPAACEQVLKNKKRHR
jgi:hypothetical protein